jgi:hypothetical protein
LLDSLTRLFLDSLTRLFRRSLALDGRAPTLGGEQLWWGGALVGRRPDAMVTRAAPFRSDSTRAEVLPYGA